VSGREKEMDTKQRFSKGLVTIVVPAYNAEQFLRENIESIINQSYENLEIIYVCDGCTDYTAEILYEYAQKDPRIIIKVEKYNHGAAISRNIGMDMATGDWIIFLDADDLFDSHMIEEMLETAVNVQADISSCYWEYFDDIPNVNVPINNEIRKLCCKTYPIIDTSKELYHIMQVVDKGPCTKLVHKSIYKKREVFFQDIPNANDVYYSMSVVINSIRIVYIDKVFLHYRGNKGRYTLSTDRNIRKNYIFEACDKVFKYIENKKDDECLLRSFYNDVFFNLNVYLDSPTYDKIFEALKNVYLDAWKIRSKNISEVLSCMSKVFYKNVVNGNKENDRQKLLMQAKVEFVCEMSKKGCSIWGAGLLGSNLLKEISGTKIEIQHLYDSDQNKWGNKVEGYIVEEPKHIKSDNIIIVTTPKYFDDIKNQISDQTRNIYNLEQQIWLEPWEREQ
jgi:glycosyltransferase involved in cell wall biosynthesis